MGSTAPAASTICYQRGSVRQRNVLVPVVYGFASATKRTFRKSEMGQKLNSIAVEAIKIRFAQRLKHRAATAKMQ